MNKKLLAIPAAAVLLGGVIGAGLWLGRPGTPAPAAPAASAAPAGPTAETVQAASASEETPAEPRDYIITLEGDKITAPDALVNGSSVTITKGGSYRVSGTLEDGQIIVDADKEDDVRIVLDGADLTCATSAPIYVKQAGNTYLYLEEGTENTVTDGTEYVLAPGEDEPDAAIFAKDDLFIRGEGALTVNGMYDMAIHGKDDVRIQSGTLTLTAPGDGIKGKDSVEIRGGDLTITAGGDGIQTNNTAERGDLLISGGTITLAAALDGIKSEHSLFIEGGTLQVTAGEDGLKAHNTIGGSELAISGGEITVDAQQDGIQAEGDLSVTGGHLEITTRGGADEAPEHAGDFFGGPPGWFNDVSEESDETVSAKGLKSAYDITISGGHISVDSYDDAIHADGSVTISGEAGISVRAGDDGIHANETLSIQGGSVMVNQSYEGLEALFIDISGGDVYVRAADDGMNANGDELFGPGFGAMNGEADTLETANTYLHITGGHVIVNSDGDGLDSNGLLLIEGGETYVSGPSSSMNGSLDSGTSALINGGTALAFGVSGMDETFGASSAQASIRCVFNTSLAGDSPITLTDSQGKVLVEFQIDAPDKRFNSVVVSCPELTVGETYTLTCGEETVEIQQTDLSTAVRQTAAGSPETSASYGFGGFGGGPGGFGGPPGGPPGF